jgi:tetratricopeptide (TPR) repeat protein
MGINRAYLQAYVHYMSREASGTNISQSVNVLTQLGEKAPDDPGLFLYLGLLNSYAKLYPAAVAAFEKAEKLAMEADLQEDVLTPSFFFWFGAACERNGEFDRAVGLFQRCIALEPAPADRVEHKAYVDALNYLAYMWAERGIELDQALAYVQRALAAHPQSAAYRRHAGLDPLHAGALRRSAPRDLARLRPVARRSHDHRSPGRCARQAGTRGRCGHLVEAVLRAGARKREGGRQTAGPLGRPGAAAPGGRGTETEAAGRSRRGRRGDADDRSGSRRRHGSNPDAGADEPLPEP